MVWHLIGAEPLSKPMMIFPRATVFHTCNTSGAKARIFYENQVNTMVAVALITVIACIGSHDIEHVG